MDRRRARPVVRRGAAARRRPRCPAPVRQLRLRLAEPGRVPETVHERVMASIVAQPAGRRCPAAAELAWWPAAATVGRACCGRSCRTPAPTWHDAAVQSARRRRRSPACAASWPTFPTDPGARPPSASGTPGWSAAGWRPRSRPAQQPQDGRLDLPVGRRLTEVGLRPEPLQGRRDGDAVVVEVDDARVDVRRPAHGRGVAEVLATPPSRAAHGSLARALRRRRARRDGEPDRHQHGRVPGAEVLRAHLVADRPPAGRR